MIDLVYLSPFIGIETKRNSPVYKYKKLNGQEDINKRTANKNKFVNCYDELEPGKSYIVITENKNPSGNHGAWVWVEAWECPPELLTRVCEQLRKLDSKSTVPGYRVSNKELFFKACGQVLTAFKIEQKMKETKKLINELMEY